jgi:GT2 family glycosyltransferase
VHFPTVSVIVLNYNGLQYMEDCFSSLSDLDYPVEHVELVLADNASHDGSVEYVREHFPQVRVIQFERNHGFCEGNNRAAAQVQSDLVAFLNSDMRVEPHWLTGLLEGMAGEREVICSSSKILNWDGHLVDFGGILLSFLGHGRADGYRNPNLTAYDDVGYILAPCGGAMLIDRKVFLDVGGFDEDYFAYFEDIDLGWRLWVLGYKVAFAPESICYHVHYGSSSKQASARIHYLYERNALYTIIKNYERRYLARVLPLALLMQFKRAYLYGRMGGVDMDACRLNSETEPAAPVQTDYDLRYYARETWRTLRDEGLLALMRRGLDELDRRRGRPVPEHIATPQQESFYWIEQAHVAAANDLIETYPDLMEKRAHIQQQRRRTDEEIFKSVRALSFDVCFNAPEYQRAQQRLMELFEIEELFGEIYDPDIPFALRAQEYEKAKEQQKE